jgi:hypothetical protein
MVAFAICAAPHESTREFAIKWLSGADRSYESAREAEAWATGRAPAAWAAAWATGATGRTPGRTAWVAACAAARAKADKERFEARLPKIWARARAILAGEYPAEEYDAPYEVE